MHLVVVVVEVQFMAAKVLPELQWAGDGGERDEEQFVDLGIDDSNGRCGLQ